MVGNEPAELTNEIEKLRRQYEKGEITEDEVISKLLKGYGVDEYISQPSYSAAFGKKYNPEKKRELVGKVAMALIYVKGGESYIDEQYKEYEDRYSKNFYDKNKLTHNTSYGVLPVDNPPKIPREEYFKQLVLDEVENVGKQAYSGEKLENDLIKSANAIVAGILLQRAYNSYGERISSDVKSIDTQGLKVIKNRTAEIANNEWKMRGYDKPPYDTTYEVKVVQAGKEEYVRVFSYKSDGTSNKLGGWIMRKCDIEGLTSSQIKDRYALPEAPTHICDVQVPSNIELQTGIANKVDAWGKGGGQQFDTMGKRLPKSSFINERRIGE